MVDIKENYFKIPEGNYIIGLSENRIDEIFITIADNSFKKNYLYNSYPEHPIQLDAIYISKKLITYMDYKSFVEETEYITDAEHDGWGWIWEGKWLKKEGLSWKRPFCNEADDFYMQYRDLLPVMQVSWYDAMAYCNWYSIKISREVRLPTEYEWEVFSKVNYIKINGQLIEDYNINDTKNFITVMLNMIEMKNFFPIGLVWEWTLDWFNSYPGGNWNKEFGSIYKVLRGGSLISHPAQKIDEYRFRRCPTARSPYYSFRIAVKSDDC